MHRLGLSGLAALIAFGVSIAGLRPAGADPVSDKQAQAQALQSQIAASNQQIDSLGEQYNGAQYRLQQSEQAIADSAARLANAQHQLDGLRMVVTERAASAYRGAVSGQNLQGLDFSDAQQLLVGQKYEASEAARDNSLVAQLKQAKQQLAAQKTAAEQARAAADADRQQINSARQSLQAATAAQQQTLSQVQGELVQLVAQAQAAQAQAALNVALNRFAPGTASNGNPGDFPNLPPPGPAAAQAIAFARAQLGKPYLWAAAGPDSYDCSGLVMAAYASAGVHLPHYSGAQYATLPHVAMNAMLPGDLLFWGDQGSEHAAIYLGAGRILEAGGTGNDVHIGPIWGQPFGAARPT